MKKLVSPHVPGMGILGLVGAVPIGIYAIRPDLLPGGFHGIDFFLVLAGFASVQRLRSGSTRGLAERVTVVLVLCVLAIVAAVTLERGPNRIHDLQGVVATSIGMLNWALQWNFEAPGSYATIVQGFWVTSAVAQLAVVTGAVALLVRTAGNVRGAGIRVAAVTAVLSFAYAATPGVYVPFNGYFATASRAWEFAAGCLLALTAPLLSRVPPIVARSLCAVGAIGFLATCWFVLPSSTTNTSWAAVPSVVFALLAMSGARSAALPALGRWSKVDRSARALTLPMVLAPGLVVGVLAYVFPPVWVPGSNPLRDWTAVACTVAVAAVAAFAARAGMRLLGGVRTTDWGAETQTFAVRGEAASPAS